MDSLSAISGTVNRLLIQNGKASVDPASMAPHIGIGLDNLLAHYFPESLEDLGTLKNEYRQLYRKFVDPTHSAYPGVAQGLEKLQGLSGVKIGIVTNRSTELAKFTVALALPKFSFDFVAGYDAVSERKPSPNHITEPMVRVGLTADRTYYVGDHEVDRLSAEAAGVAFFAAGYGFGKVQVPAAAMANSFSELIDKLIGVLGRG